MNTLRTIFHLALADFYERSRRYSFLLILAAIIYIGVLVNQGTLGMDLGSASTGDTMIRYRGVFNSAWIGAMTVMVSNLFLSLFGFYLVSDSIKRDLRTGVGQIIATTPISRADYLIGKWISNFMVLSVLILILAIAAVIMVLLKREGTLELGVLLMPFLVVALPNVALTAALAVVFETVPWLRGAIGNVVYFFLWISINPVVSLLGKVLPFFKDPNGYAVFTPSLHASASLAFPQEMILKGLSIGGGKISGTLSDLLNIPQIEYRVFTWKGLTWTPGIVGGQWLWVVISMGLILLSALWFARFDPALEGLRWLKIKPGEVNYPKLLRQRDDKYRRVIPGLSALVSKIAQINPFIGVLCAELRLLLNGRRWWWIIYFLQIAIIFGSPTDLSHAYLIPIAWLLPLAIWSDLGNREKKNNTSQMVFSSPKPVLRQLPAAWVAGVLMTALVVIGPALFYIHTGDMTGLAGWAGAVVFVPTLALALGVVSSSNRVFEVVYVVWWYIGPLQKLQGIDFTNGVPLFYILAAAGLLVISLFWRIRQVRV